MNNHINSQYLHLENARIHYLETGQKNSVSVLLLHGASFTAHTWQEIGTLDFLNMRGYRAVAVDIPGYGRSQRISVSSLGFLREILNNLNLNLPILVSPSMSGSYSLPFVINYGDKLGGFVGISPVGIERFQDELKGIELPTLAIWGSNDRIVPIEQADLLVELIPNAQKIILNDAGHACYMKKTEEFHKHLIKFIQSIKH
ncbi:alpha/beta hydrolase [Okeania sp.]|uniref:alpha/beta fold hydrolase n=1 Tax=Okeania sp. TaxID=3100323 RepID=UPI002B4ADF9F|nr:alpha/beta hydrolase [Okeania sp.]MEB3340701.1 alpha/beta hydrolase [Okeania sp.]